MEKREQAVTVVLAELRDHGSGNRWVHVVLNTGHGFQTRPEQAPKVGATLLMTLTEDDDLDVVRDPEPFTREDLRQFGASSMQRMDNPYRAGVQEAIG